MRKLWLIWLLVFSGWLWLPGQRNVALLDAPVRSLQRVHVDKDGQEAYPFVLDRGLIYLEAQLEGTPGAYILDTGAPGLVINEEPTKPNEAYYAQSCAQEVEIGVRPVEHFAWGDREWQEMEAIALDLQHLKLKQEHVVNGLLGYELLQEYVVLLNYQQEQLCLLERPMNLALHQPLARLPFVLEGHLPVVEVKVGPHTLRLGVDTGSASNILDASWYATLQSSMEKVRQEELQGLDQTVHRVEAVELRHLQFGEGVLDTRFLLLDLSHLQTSTTLPLDGLLGHDFLANFTVAIDYPRNEILLWPAHLER